MSYRDDKYFHRNNFNAHTNLPALKPNAIELCGKAFCENLRKQRIYAYTEEFWSFVNKNLNIPSDAYEKQQAEKQQKEKAEQERLLAQKRKRQQKEYKDWQITIFELPDSDLFGKVFTAECTKEPNIKIELGVTHYSPKSVQDAYRQAHSRMDSYDDFSKQQEANLRRYRGLRPLYLIMLYLSGWDKFLPGQYNEEDNEDNKPKKFLGVEFYNGLDYDILNQLTAEKLIEFSSSRKQLWLTPEAVKEARKIIKKLNFEEIKELLTERDYHEELLNDSD
jgi:hypothetical protein